MPYALTTEQRRVPHQEANNIHLPDLQIVRRVPGDAGAWQRLNSSYTPAKEPLDAFVAVVDLGALDAEQEAKGIEKLAQQSPRGQAVLTFAGYVLDGLYLQAAPNNHTNLQQTALIAHLLLRYWQPAATQGNPAARQALPMLARVYWRALDQLRRITAGSTQRSLLATWHAWQAQYVAAREGWLAICLDDSQAWFFDDLLVWEQTRGTPGLPATAVALRERELDALVWADGRRPTWFNTTSQLCPPGSDTTAGRRWLQTLVQTWYLPRYDILAARQLTYQIAAAESNWLALQPLALLSTGTARLFAGIGVGYLATGFQSDTWKLLGYLMQYPGRGVILGLLLGLGSLAYLWQGIQRRVGFAGLRRALILWLHGQGFAYLIGIITVLIVQGSPLLDGVKIEPILLTPLLHAQLTLFVGIFTELLFGDKPATAPLDAP